MKRVLNAIVLWVVWAGLPAAASEPLYVKNLSPVTGLSGLPSQRSAQTAADGGMAVALHSSIANHYVNDGEKNEFLNLDGETLRFALELRYGLAENWDIQVEVPWLRHSGGNLDRAIDEWHDIVGGDGGRSNVPRDMLDYRYLTQDGGFGLLDSASGLGDISLSLSHAFYRDDHAVASLVLGYKFDTGDEDEFTGSGANDAFVAIRFSGAHLSDLPLNWHAQAGYLRAGDSNLLGDYQEKDLWFAGLSLDWMFAQHWSLIGQIDSHAAPLDSNISGVGNVAYMGSLGARWDFAPRWSVDFSMIEDIGVETAPDVTFQASVRYRSWRQD